jgi:hypothetical protein
MLRTRSIWFACITLGVLLALLAAGRANAQVHEPTRVAPPGPACTWVSQTSMPAHELLLVHGWSGATTKTGAGGERQ